MCEGSTPYPIRIINGNKYLREVDVEVKVLGGLEISRHYNGLGGYSTLMVGANWSLNIDRSLSLYGTDKITAFRGDGKQLGFTLSGSQFRPSGGGGDVISQIFEAGAISGWRYTNAAAREVELYDTNGRLVSIANSQGVSWTLARDSVGRVVEVASNLGRKVTLTYATNYRLAKLTLPDGSQIAYGYDGLGNLTTVTYPDGQIRIYGYNEAGQTSGATLPNALTSITDENGVRYITYTYDATGRAIGEVLDGGVGGYDLTFNTGNTVVKDPLGTSRTYNHQGVLGVARSTGQSQPGGSGCGAASSAIGYDANGNIATRTDFAGHTTTYTYDLTRNLELTRTEGAGTTAARTISTTWHPDWRLEARRAEPKKLTTWVYNGQPDPTAGNAVAACAPSDALLPDGKPIAVLCKQIEQATTDETGAAGFSASVTGEPRISTWTYTRYGQVLTADGPRTDVNDVTTTTYYDAADPDLGKRGKVATITNALGHVTEFTSYDANGRVTGMIDPNGVTTSVSYDLRGHLTAKTVGGETTSYTYDPVGQLTAVSLPAGSGLTYTYDAAHRLIAIADGVGNRVQYTLDAMGNRVKEEVRDPTDNLVRIQSRVYDALGRLQNLVQPQ
jgi:YD repeat-containing protein